LARLCLPVPVDGPCRPTASVFRAWPGRLASAHTDAPGPEAPDLNVGNLLWTSRSPLHLGQRHPAMNGPSCCRPERRFRTQSGQPSSGVFRVPGPRESGAGQRSFVSAGAGRVEMWRGDGRSEHRCCRPFRLAVPYEPDHGSVSTSRSSNRTCRSPASGSRTRLHAFAHDRWRPRQVSRTSPSRS
jgi:hypothetical protein